MLHQNTIPLQRILINLALQRNTNQMCRCRCRHHRKRRSRTPGHGSAFRPRRITSLENARLAAQGRRAVGGRGRGSGACGGGYGGVGGEGEAVFEGAGLIEDCLVFVVGGIFVGVGRKDVVA
jgi:hypothetical protein